MDDRRWHEFVDAQREYWWQKVRLGVLWALLSAARDGTLEPDWRVVWAERTAMALRAARAGDPDWLSVDAAQHVRAVYPWPRVGPEVPVPVAVLAGVQELLSAVGESQEREPSLGDGEIVLLVLRDLAENTAGDWWLWEPRAAATPMVTPAQAVPRWWSAAVEVIDAAETWDLKWEAALRDTIGVRPTLGAREMSDWARATARVREQAQQKRDLVWESATAAATALDQVAPTPGPEPVPGGWWRAAEHRVRQWRDKTAAEAHLAELADPAYRAALEQLPECWQ
ncbi:MULTISPECIES: hypothetical protein [Mycobacteriaceae]|uniref:hypothetical protein n=1 Tax=Mycobacteriaceae TaxID=1762 RepID=UPI000C257FB8|nr:MULTISPECIES: hypothetical protein [Mycobacteriaceae]